MNNNDRKEERSLLSSIELWLLLICIATVGSCANTCSINKNTEAMLNIIKETKK